MAEIADEPVVPTRGDGLVRLRLELSYDGTDFAGWASQPGLRTVQDVLEQALATALRVDRPRLVVAGRNDAGVHALGQVAHCELPAGSWAAGHGRIIRQLAGLLSGDVRVRSVTEVGDDFDARFSALWRSYRYRICDRAAGVDPLRRRDTASWRRTLDVTSMRQAARALLGLHDFVAFCRRREGASTIRQLQRLEVSRHADIIEVAVRADAFCHSMVRSLVGALAAVGEGRQPVEWPADLLGLNRRSDQVTVAPARGLTLLEVGYPDAAGLAARAAEARALRTAST
ncbi:MAG: tRNA pseudouridine(38-40) synthase TruA [Jatrophihabitans sp.]